MLPAGFGRPVHRKVQARRTSGWQLPRQSRPRGGACSWGNPVYGTAPARLLLRLAWCKIENFPGSQVPELTTYGEAGERDALWTASLVHKVECRACRDGTASGKHGPASCKHCSMESVGASAHSWGTTPTTHPAAPVPGWLTSGIPLGYPLMGRHAAMHKFSQGVPRNCFLSACCTSHRKPVSLVAPAVP